MNKNTKTLIALLAVSGIGLIAQAVDYTWTGGGANANWSNPDNWSSSTDYPRNSGDKAIFSGVAANFTQPFADSGIQSLTRVVFDVQSGGWIFGGSNEIRLRGGSSFAGGVTTVNGPWRFDERQNFSIADGSVLLLNGNFNNAQQMNVRNGGTMVVSQNATQSTVDQEGLRIFDGSTALLNINLVSNRTISQSDYWVEHEGSTLGGTGGITFTESSRGLTIANGGRLSPGGNGTYGAQIGTFDVATNDTAVTFASGSSLLIDLGATAGDNDRLTVNASGSTGGYLDLTAGDAILELFGSDPEIGTYTIATFNNPGNVNYGEFGSVLYNGEALDPEFGSLTYGSNDIVLSVIPEPSTLLLVGVALISLTFLRRRKA